MSTGEVGRLSAALTLDGAHEFQAQLESVGRKLKQTGQEVQKTGDLWQDSAGKWRNATGQFASSAEKAAAGVDNLGQKFDSARTKSNALGDAAVQVGRTTAGAITALSGAAAGYVTILAKTGVEYNSLQQNSRAALKVLMGGAEQASAQMDKLDAFARNSPFSKSVFIEAQQQLLGFGVEAKKVIPYLDAIQNTVASTGGSSNRISELSLIMSQIQSSAKITAGDLREFGNRGVDAAALIGSQMGKTANEIRSEITAGTLDAQIALDALAAGMQETYGGTTALVKEQWTGATDRIKAANRDIGAIIAEPFVSKDGGGMAVQWGNQVADVLRAIEKQATPVMSILVGNGTPIFDGITTGLDKAQMSIERFNPERVSEALDKMKQHAPGLAALAGSIIAVGSSVGPLGALLSTLNISINPVVAGFVGLAAASPDVRAALADLLDAGKPLIPVLGDVAELASGALNSALPLVADGIGLVVGVARPLVDILSAIPTPILLGVGAFVALNQSLKPLSGGIGDVLGGVKKFAEEFSALVDVTGNGQQFVGLATDMGSLGAASFNAQRGVRGLGNALKTAFLTNPVGIALTAVATAVAVWSAANAAAQKNVEEHRERVQGLKSALDQTNGAMTDAARAQVEQNLETAKARENAERMGIQYSDVTQAALGNADAVDRVAAATREYVEANGALMNDSGDIYKGSSEQSKIAAKTANELTGAITNQADAVAEAKRQTREKIQADRELAGAMSESERASKRFDDALSVARDTSSDLTSRLSALKQALDELNGGQITAEEQAKRFHRANLALADGLAQLDENGQSAWKNAISDAGEIDISTKAGLDFSDAVDKMNDSMLEAALKASDTKLANNDLEGAIADATAAVQSQQDTMRATLTEYGLTDTQINALIDSMGSVPEVVATALVAQGYDITDAQLVGLLTKLSEIPEGKTITIDEPESPAIMAKLESLGYTIKHLPGKKIEITSTGEDNVRAVINELAQPVTKTINLVAGSMPSFGEAGWRAPMLMSGGARDGGMFRNSGDGLVKEFRNGGLPSGYYSAPAGEPALFKFAEQELPWELFISPQPGKEKENAGYALEGLRRLGFPSIPIAALGGTPGARAMLGGGITGATASTQHERYESTPGVRRGSRTAPLIGTVNLGSTSRSDLDDLMSTVEVMERLE